MTIAYNLGEIRLGTAPAWFAAQHLKLGREALADDSQSVQAFDVNIFTAFSDSGWGVAGPIVPCAGYDRLSLLQQKPGGAGGAGGRPPPPGPVRGRAALPHRRPVRAAGRPGARRAARGGGRLLVRAHEARRAVPGAVRLQRPRGAVHGAVPGAAGRGGSPPRAGTNANA
eukprot:CAMPEP_0194590792 /NCGR_PEP_ID=MMETSP0292-20121207/21617_1 /TAXON_ID=39354 /ORGANISM="Heterosigma akashiwo, Strain CCMP2393" /LENGTH=169 /DNA_ID=CAMNT_0039448615 /DNA_START=396 /DNA_END=906 /DNA_ORIENTATION=-